MPTITAYTDEAALQMMLRDAPELLPGGDDRRPVVVVAEFGVSVGAVDLVGVAPTGAITVVECKLRANPEIRRSIVGQLFAYASALWGMRIMTYVGGKWTNSGSNLEKRFPEDASTNFGYYTFCQTDGHGYVVLSGADIQDRSIWDIGTFKSANISVCWTRTRSTPPGGDCYNFTIHPGD